MNNWPIYRTFPADFGSAIATPSLSIGEAAIGKARALRLLVVRQSEQIRFDMSNGQSRQPSASIRRGSMTLDGRNGSAAASPTSDGPRQTQPSQDKGQGTCNSASSDGRSLGPISPPLGTASSSTSSFVFPVRSVFANMQQPGRSNPSQSQGASLSRMTSRASNASHRGNRSQSLATSEDGAEAIRGHAESITQMLESASHSNLPQARPGQISEVGTTRQQGQVPSPHSESSGAFTERVYSAPLHRDGEQPPSASYFELKGRRSSDGSPNISPPHDTSRVPTQSSMVTESAPHAYGQVDPVPQEASAPGLQTTAQCPTNVHDNSNAYRFSDRPGVDRESDQPPSANTSGKSDARERIMSKRDDSRDNAPRATSPKTHVQSHGETNVEVPIHADHTPGEPDVGPAIDRPTDMTDIVRLGHVGRSRSSADSKSTGSASQAQRPSVNRHQSVDHQQSVRNFVNKQAETENMPDPNAPTPSERSGDNANDYLAASASRRRTSNNMEEVDGILGLESPEHDSDSDEDGDSDMDGDNNRVAVRDSESQSQLSENTADEPVMTVRFEHVTTEDGHHVVVGREGKLQKCEDEVRLVLCPSFLALR